MKRLIVRFDNEKDLDNFSKKLSLNLTKSTKEIYLPKGEVKYKKDSTRASKEGLDLIEDSWVDMPEYISTKQEPYAKIDMYFDDYSLDKLSDLFEQSITNKTKSIWYPKLIPGKNSQLMVVGGTSDTKYPIYVVSKGRYNPYYTSRFLTQMEVKHYVVVEPQEIKLYEQFVENEYATILQLDMSYKDNYDTFDDLGDTKPKGVGGARNFCWEHSILNGHKWHWVMDDNTNEGFHYMNRNKKHKCRTGAMFQACERFVDRYDNIAIAGLNYTKFCLESNKSYAYVLNTRIYSYLLIRNDIPYRWRGRYNEDTDLSLRVLKDGWCTVQFNAFLAGKCTTQKIKGGNTDEFYSKEGTYPKSKMLEDMHPDVSKVVWKFNRWHHQVDYSGFKQQLKLKKEVEEEWRKNTPPKVNNLGMVAIDTEETATTDSKSYLEEKYKDYLIK